MITKTLINDICYSIVGCAIEVHKELGPGLLESIYENCLIKELKSKGHSVLSQVQIPLFYKGEDLKQVLKLDLFIDDLVIVELKSVDVILPVFKAQLLTYLKLTNKSKGLLINFNCVNITKDGLVPLVNESFSLLPA